MRIERDEVNIQVAHAMALRSTCLRKKVGCVITLEGRIIVTGYNGSASGVPHCEECNGPGCDIAVHAEAGAISFAARKGIALEGSTLYVTMSPCKKCADLILNAGIKKVIYDEEYRDTQGIDYLKQFIIVIKYEKESVNYGNNTISMSTLPKI